MVDPEEDIIVQQVADAILHPVFQLTLRLKDLQKFEVKHSLGKIDYKVMSYEEAHENILSYQTVPLIACIKGMFIEYDPYTNLINLQAAVAKGRPVCFHESTQRWRVMNLNYQRDIHEFRTINGSFMAQIEQLQVDISLLEWQ